ncbi:hypothetical protein LTR08_000311 [Meristemomyces frigidus]|nr:hypothetical protein LTR08_000311 [Meristemomyces frigidus]
MSASRTPNLISATDKELHGFKRRVIMQTMTDQALKDAEERIIALIQTFVEMVGRKPEGDRGVTGHWGPDVDMGTAADWLTFDVISDLLYGRPLGLLQSAELRWLPEVFRSISQMAATSLFQPKFYLYKINRLFLAARRRKLLQTGRWLGDLAREREQLGNDTQTKDIFYTMMNAEDPKTGRKFTRKDMWVESVLLLAAGESMPIP